jgi:hypothetical protein
MKTRLALTVAAFLGLAALSSAEDAAKPSAPFDQTLTLLGVSFHVTSPNAAAANALTITPSGLTGENRAERVEVKATVLGAEVADLNVDGSPELYIYLRAADGTGALVAYAANHKKSLSQIALPALTDVPKNATGYRGGDEFAVVESTLVRRFPIYPADPAVATPTGKMRQLQYKLKAGEAGWLLRLDKALEF